MLFFDEQVSIDALQICYASPFIGIFLDYYLTKTFGACLFIFLFIGEFLHLFYLEVGHFYKKDNIGKMVNFIRKISLNF